MRPARSPSTAVPSCPPPRRAARALSPLLALAAAATAPVASGCRREDRLFQQPPALAAEHTGVDDPTRRSAHPPRAVHNEYEQSAWAVNEGARLYVWFNCAGCHAQGGGGIGPALMDAEWRYGSAPTQVFDSIVEGRPNGMPSFRGKMPEQQVWELVAYVRSLSGQLRFDREPGRNDSMSNGPPPAMRPSEHPYGHYEPHGRDSREVHQ